METTTSEVKREDCLVKIGKTGARPTEVTWST